MKQFMVILAILLAVLAAAPISAAGEEFGLEGLQAEFIDQDGSSATAPGTHPFAFRTVLDTKIDSTTGLPVEPLEDLEVYLPEGIAGNPDATPFCSMVDFFTDLEDFEFEGVAVGGSACENRTVVGVAAVKVGFSPLPPGEDQDFAAQGAVSVYNLVPPPGVASKLGFNVLGVRVVIETTVNPEPPHNIVSRVTNTPQAVYFYGSTLTVWGNPADPAHDQERGYCLHPQIESCPVDIPQRRFLILPRSCEGPLATLFRAYSWPEPPSFFEESATSPAMIGCDKLVFSPQIKAEPTSRAAQSPSGLDFSLEVDDPALTATTAPAQSDIRKVVVTLPEGFSANPALAEGLEVCSEAQLDAESPFFEPGKGCPEAAKIGTVEVETPLLEGELLKGSLYIAEPYKNEFGSLLALYIVIRSPELGIVVKQALEVEPDPETGRLTTVAEDLPQLPFSDFRLHFREGARSPLATPPSCGTHEVEAVLTPSSGGPAVTATSAFEIFSGPDNGPCPTGGLPPFRPGLIAGTLNNAAGRFSPFNLRLHRTDAEQEFTRFSIKLPPGIAGILAGIPKCSDAAIEAAKTRTGREELASPSCPAASEVGRSLAGAGVGPALTYAPGKIYLAGPYEGSPISIAAITAAVVGPFDVGTVVIRQGFKIDPRTAEVFLDPIGSDPIPHIIKGIVVHARDIRAYVDRPNFVFNPTSCERTSTASTLLGSGLDFVSAHDDNPVVVSTPFQAADCAALPFKPKLRFRLKGGTKRGAHPSLRAHLEAGGLGNANIASARVTLPRSEFLENAHIGTVCTRVQYAADQCPAASVYGFASATTPILDQPLKGPIYLRSSENELPDLVAAFKSAEGIKFDLIGRVDSVKGGGIRNAFEIVPDAPVTSADFTFFGANKGLLVNSTNLCRGRHLVKVELKAHSGKVSNYKTPLKAKCGKKGAKKKRSRRHTRAQR